MQQRSNAVAWVVLVMVLLLPLVSMELVPFYDTSEPRYAEMARVMAQTGDWITPWFNVDVPFWGKPPLSFWAQALSMKVLGVTEFAGRLPSWLCLITTNILLLTALKSMRGIGVALWAAIIYSTCTLVYISSGAVLTDPFLALGTTLSLVSFARVIDSGERPVVGSVGQQPSSSGNRRNADVRWWQYGFFLGLTIGLLAKGPLAALIIFAPITVWWWLTRKATSLTALLPWRNGLLLTALLTLPWYVAAEIKTPGFLDYFIVGEHFRRFLAPGWAGDLYGSAHRRTYGMIWVYWIQASFPWGLLALAALGGAVFSPKLRSAAQAVYGDPLFFYWVTAALFTPVFFTFSANILWTYVLPSLAGFSILAAMLAQEVRARYSIPRVKLITAAALVPLVVLGGSLVVWINPDLRNTERELVRYVIRQPGPSSPLFYLSELPFSARFYSSGHARAIKEAELQQIAQQDKTFYLAAPKTEPEAVYVVSGKRLTPVFSNRRYNLLKVSKANSPLVAVRSDPN